MPFVEEMGRHAVPQRQPGRLTEKGDRESLRTYSSARPAIGRSGHPSGDTSETNCLERVKMMVQLERESLNSLFETLLLWEDHLAQHDLSDLGCDDEHFG